MNIRSKNPERDISRGYAITFVVCHANDPMYKHLNAKVNHKLYTDDLNIEGNNSERS